MPFPQSVWNTLEEFILAHSLEASRRCDPLTMLESAISILQSVGKEDMVARPLWVDLGRCLLAVKCITRFVRSLRFICNIFQMHDPGDFNEMQLQAAHGKSGTIVQFFGSAGQTIVKKDSRVNRLVVGSTVRLDRQNIVAALLQGTPQPLQPLLSVNTRLSSPITSSWRKSALHTIRHAAYLQTLGSFLESIRPRALRLRSM